MEELEGCDFTREERRDPESRLADLRVYEGVTCSIELAFDYQSRLYVYDSTRTGTTSSWTIGDEIDAFAHRGRR